MLCAVYQAALGGDQSCPVKCNYMFPLPQRTFPSSISGSSSSFRICLPEYSLYGLNYSWSPRENRRTRALKVHLHSVAITHQVLPTPTPPRVFRAFSRRYFNASLFFSMTPGSKRPAFWCLGGAHTPPKLEHRFGGSDQPLPKDSRAQSEIQIEALIFKSFKAS